MEKINWDKVRGALIAAMIGSGTLGGTALAYHKKINLPNFKAYEKQLIDINKDKRVDYFYPDSGKYAIQRDDGKFDICYVVMDNGVGFLVSRDKKNIYYPKENLR